LLTLVECRTRLMFMISVFVSDALWFQ
jgi:hypothetical protein